MPSASPAKTLRGNDDGQGLDHLDGTGTENGAAPRSAWLKGTTVSFRCTAMTVESHQAWAEVRRGDVVFATWCYNHEVNTTVSLAQRLSEVTTPTERRVAEFSISAGPTAAAMSAREIAEAVGTSDATVLRTTKTLGFSSLRELRRALSEDARDPDLSSRLHATIDGRQSPHDVLSAAIDQHVLSLDLLSHQVRPEDFDAATAILSRAAHIWWCGTGPSAHLARYAAFLSRRMGFASGAVTRLGSPTSPTNCRRFATITASWCWPMADSMPMCG